MAENQDYEKEVASFGPGLLRAEEAAFGHPDPRKKPPPLTPTKTAHSYRSKPRSLRQLGTGKEKTNDRKANIISYQIHQTLAQVREEKIK